MVSCEIEESEVNILRLKSDSTEVSMHGKRDWEERKKRGVGN